MPEARRSFWDSKWIFPAAAVALIAAVAGLDRCPIAHPMAQDFSLPVISPDGRVGPDRMSVRDLRGKVVLVDFWATWCGPCRASTPALVHLWHRYRDRGLVVMGVNVDQEGPGVVPAFMQRFGVDYPVLYDDGQASDRYNVRALPTAVLIDRTGRIQRVHTGIAGEDDLARQIERLL